MVQEKWRYRPLVGRPDREGAEASSDGGSGAGARAAGDAVGREVAGVPRRAPHRVQPTMDGKIVFMRTCI
jgi:hypothetical protein